MSCCCLSIRFVSPNPSITIPVKDCDRSYQVDESGEIALNSLVLNYEEIFLIPKLTDTWNFIGAGVVNTATHTGIAVNWHLREKTKRGFILVLESPVPAGGTFIFDYRVRVESMTIQP